MMMLVVGLSAQPISEQEALQKAQRFLKGKSMVSLDKAANTRGSVNVKPFKHLYLFNAEDNGGFVIVAGDSRAREILGYADEGHLDYSQMPENMKWWLNFYDESIASIPADVTVAETRAADDSKPAVKPMMSYSWNQMSPYNYYCPQGCLSGCIPTAMAQMLVFHGYPIIWTIRICRTTIRPSWCATADRPSRSPTVSRLLAALQERYHPHWSTFSVSTKGRIMSIVRPIVPKAGMTCSTTN